MRSLKLWLGCLVLLAADRKLILMVCSGLPPIHQRVVQLGTYWEQSDYGVQFDRVTKQLVFGRPSEPICLFLKQTFLDFTNGFYIALKLLLLTDETALPSGFDYYLTRDKNQTLKLYPNNAPFSAADIRFFKQVYCPLLEEYAPPFDVASTMIYWGSGPYSVLTASKDRVLTLVEGADKLSCGTALFEFHSVNLP